MIEKDDYDECEEFDISSVSDYDLVEECQLRDISLKNQNVDIVTETQLEEMNELFLSLPSHKREDVINDLKKW